MRRLISSAVALVIVMITVSGTRPIEPAPVESVLAER